jgi:hypothetical protein
MVAGTTVDWDFADVGAKLSADVIAIDKDRGIIFEWTAKSLRTRVTISLESQGPNSTFISVRESSWPRTREGLASVLSQTRGWTDFLCCMKGYLEYGVNLRTGRASRFH